MGRWWLVVSLVASACVESNSVRCEDGRTCPVGTVCYDAGSLCVLPDQLTVCMGHPDGEQCTIVAANDGICNGDVCLPPACGDEIVSTGEQCDASIPAEGTCVDQAY